MFCPDCGRECKEANFCLDCGRALPIPEVKKIFCPDCGRNCEGFAFCPDCGRQLHLPREKSPCKKTVLPKPPVGVYRERHNYILLDKQSLKIHRTISDYDDSLFFNYKRPVERVIKYDEIIGAYFIEPKGFRLGRLIVRDKKDQYNPLPPPKARYRELLYDGRVVLFSRVNSRMFYNVYLYLKQCADIVNAAENE